MQEYLERRARTPETADAQFKLASWCEQNGLKAQADRPFPAGHAPGPERDAAWKHLGFKKQGSTGSSPSWWPPPGPGPRSSRRPTSTGSRSWSAIDRPSRARARRGAPTPSRPWRKITEPDAVPMVWATFGRGEPSLQKVAVQVLGQIDDGAASRSLVLLAVFGGSADVRSRGDRDAPPPRRARVRLDAHRHDPRADRVRGEEDAGPGPAGRAPDQGAGLGAERQAAVLAARGPAITPQPGDRVFSTRTDCPSSSGRRCLVRADPGHQPGMALPQQPRATPAQQQASSSSCSPIAARRREPENRPDS